jgi:hypothetical protein
MHVTCSVCGEAVKGKSVRVRSGRELTLWRCEPCEFEFFAHDPTASLTADMLDDSRLKAAGLEIPPLERDFANGIEQSRSYIVEYLESADQEANVLEVGCSWGYLLKLVRDVGAKPYGVELSAVRARFVNETLGIPCDLTLDECERRGIKFRKIFLLYTLEHVPDPVGYLERLLSMLSLDGALIVVTPNLRDPLRDVWRNEAFRRFFYDEHSINYFTPRTVERAMQRLGRRRAVIATRQGYSFANHLSWYLTNAPRTTGVVGGDTFISGVTAALTRQDADPRWDAERKSLGARVADLVAAFDAQYRRVFEEQRYGNQIRFVIRNE